MTPTMKLLTLLATAVLPPGVAAADEYTAVDCAWAAAVVVGGPVVVTDPADDILQITIACTLVFADNSRQPLPTQTTDGPVAPVHVVPLLSDTTLPAEVCTKFSWTYESGGPPHVEDRGCIVLTM